MKTIYIDVKHRIWETQIKVEDYGDKLKVTLPCTKVDELGGDSLSFYKEVITKEYAMTLIRKMAERNQFSVYSKDGGRMFNIIEIIEGIPFAYGWLVEDFDI